MANKFGVSPLTVVNWESNATTPNYQHWEAIAHFLGYNPFPSARTLAEQLVLYRKLHGLSQKQMAKVLRVDPSTLAKWEQGQRQPSSNHLKGVEAFLGKVS